MVASTDLCEMVWIRQSKRMRTRHTGASCPVFFEAKESKTYCQKKEGKTSTGRQLLTMFSCPRVHFDKKHFAFICHVHFMEHPPWKLLNCIRLGEAARQLLSHTSLMSSVLSKLTHTGNVLPDVDFSRVTRKAALFLGLLSTGRDGHPVLNKVP
jgi:hypothetical protein